MSQVEEIGIESFTPNIKLDCSILFENALQYFHNTTIVLVFILREYISVPRFQNSKR